MRSIKCKLLLKKSTLFLTLFLGLILLVTFYFYWANTSQLKNFAKVTKNIDNSYERAKAIEAYQKDKEGSYFERLNESTLLIKKDGNQITLHDDVDKDIHLRAYYNYHEYIKSIDCFLVHIQYWEGTEYALINLKTKEIKKIWGLPLISPDNKKLLITNQDLVSHYTHNGIQIIRVENNKFISELEIKLPWGPSHAKWVGNTKIKLAKTAVQYRTEPGIYQGDEYYIKSKIYIHLKKEKWILPE